MTRFTKTCLMLPFGWLYYVCLTCFAGAMLGVATHLLFAWLFVESPDQAWYAAFGFMNGLRYAGVWAGGLAIVLCVVKLRKVWLAEHAEAPSEGGRDE